MGRCRLGIASPALASIGVLLVSAAHESTSEQRGNNKLVSIAPQCHGEGNASGIALGGSIVIITLPSTIGASPSVYLTVEIRRHDEL